MAYAKGTSVPVERSKAELEKLLGKAGADCFASGWTPESARITFRMHGKFIRIEMPLPKLLPKTPSWQQKKGQFYSEDKHSAEMRRRWRSMVLYVKAKLESVESNIVTFEEAFLAHVLLPNGQTTGQLMLPQIESAYKSGEMPKQIGGW